MIKCALLNVERGTFHFTRIPEWSKGTDSSSVAFASWVRIPLRVYMGNGMSPFKRPPPSNWGEKITRTDAVRHDYIT